MHSGKIFKNGNSLAIRLPKSLDIDIEKGDDVKITIDNGKIIICPINESWKDFFANKSKAEENFMDFDREDLPQDRECIF